MSKISLAEMQNGTKSRIEKIDGGIGLQRRLHAMGIRPGKVVTKCSEMFMRGPVVIRVEGTQVALGYGMASKIIVNTDEEPG